VRIKGVGRDLDAVEAKGAGSSARTSDAGSEPSAAMSADSDRLDNKTRGSATAFTNRAGQTVGSARGAVVIR